MKMWCRNYQKENAGGVISELGEQQEKEAGNGNGLEV